MSFNLKDELNKLSSTAPVLRDIEDFSDDETKAKVGEKTTEYEDELDFKAGDGNRRIRAAIGDLSEYGSKYKGKRISRKEMKGSDIESEEDEDEDEDEQVDEEEDDNFDNDDDDDEELEDDEEEELDEKPKKQKKQEPLKLSNFNQKEEIAKGLAVKNQLNFWDNLVESRVRLQNVLNTVNQYPQYDKFDKIIQNLSDDFKSSNDSLIKENQESIIKVMNQLIELQQRLVQRDPETNYVINDLKLNVNKSDDLDSKKEVKNLKRKRINSEGSNEEPEDQQDDEEDEDDEEIYSDTDEEMRAEEIKKAKKQKKLKNFHFTELKPEQFEDYLVKFNKSFQKYRDSTIQKWYDKTRLTTGKSFESLEKPILQQIEHILLDKDRIIRRTQLKRGQYKIIGKEDRAQEEENLDALKDRHLKDYDCEIFDDQDFYNQLLRELIERKSNNISDPIELSRKSIELQRLRSKNKKKVDTKASKGRKIKFDIHKPLVNFMAPIYRVTMSEEARNELYRSLFGGNQQQAEKAHNKNDDIDFSSLFKGF
ncbi:unnamed protein product [Brachionus calyciflorus]|uniref:Protein AATF n=1 Tax=Brachionus calyciflorus TaxID=104777 RepID=A0A813PF03_9BILA|nr:unnamed protein product [Brachionus calyciflorus]